MPKHSQYQVEKPREDKRKIHPVWRGIGCISMVIIPVLAYFGADWLISYSNASWIIIPQEIVVQNYADPLIFVKIVYALIIALLLFFILAIITFVMNRLYTPKSRY